MTDPESRLQRFRGRSLEWWRALEPDPDLERGTAARTWASPAWALICLAILVATAIHPADGLPIRFCAFHAVSGLDCPGCGMTRGLSSLWRGGFIQATRCHPFAPFAFVYLAIQSSYLFMPSRVRRRCVEHLNRFDGPLWRAGVWGTLGFMAYGVGRALFQLVASGPHPF